MFSKIQRVSESYKGLVKTALSLTFRISNSLGLKREPRICTPDKLPGDAEAAGPWSMLLRVTAEEFSIM